METGLSSPAHREDWQERLPIREAHFIIVPLNEVRRHFHILRAPNCRFVIRDRDAIFSRQVDSALRGFGIRVLKTPVRTPTANAFCERLIGTLRRECLDYLIPVSERHVQAILKEYVIHYNRGRPHSALGPPGIPEPPQAKVPASGHRHKLPIHHRVKSTAVLGGLHHEYGLGKEAA